MLFEHGFLLNREQQEIFDLLQRLLGDGPASFFMDACRLMSEHQNYRTATHLVAHCIREIESAIRDVLRPSEKRQSDHKTEVEKILNGLDIPKEKKERLTELCSGNKKNHKEEIKVIVSSMSMLEDEKREYIKLLWNELADKLHKFAHRRGLDTPRPVDNEFLTEFWVPSLRLLKELLDYVEKHYVIPILKKVDNLLSVDNPTKKHVKQLLNSVPSSLIGWGKFFQELNNPKWLPMLRRGKFFRHPPAAVRTGDFIQFPLCPQSGYLVRMAKRTDAKEEAAKVLMDVPLNDNVRVNMDLIDAALELPPDRAAEWVRRKELKWIKEQDYFYLLLPEKLAELISYLARGGEGDTALELARVVLRPIPHDDSVGILYSPWSYSKIIKDYILTCLLDAKPQETFSLLCDLLNKALQIVADSTNEEKPRDYSCVWYNRIEDDRWGKGYREVEEILTTAVKHAAKALIDRQISTPREVVRQLESREWYVFRRIALHLATEYADQVPDIVKRYLTDANIVWERHFFHEYVMLLKRQFAALPRSGQRKVLLTIVREPPPSYASDKNSNRRHRIRRLMHVKEHLFGWFKVYYEKLVERYNERFELKDVKFEIETLVGWRSPKTAEELLSMGVDKVIEYLLKWEPDKDWPGEPSKEGLAGQLLEAVKREPQEYSNAAHRFIEQGVSDIYVSSLLYGLENALRDGEKDINWESVLSLCEKVAGRKKGQPVHRAVAEFVFSALHKEVVPESILLKTKGIIIKLLDNVEPIELPEKQQTETETDPLTHAINTAKGTAVEALLAYAFNIAKKQEKNKQRRRFEDDVREILTTLLTDKKKHPSQAIHSLFGRWLHILYWCDELWVKENIKHIFPEEERYWDAAWGAYVCFGKPRGPLFKLLLPYYERAIEDVVVRNKKLRFGGAYSHNRLAEHLALWFLVGKLHMNDKLLEMFYRDREGVPNDAACEARAHFAWAIWQEFEGSNDPSYIKRNWNRVKELWKRRVSAFEKCEEEDKRLFERELSYFALAATFSPGGLKDVEKLLQRTAHIFGAENIVATGILDYLAEQAPLYPDASVKVLRKLADGEMLRNYAWYKKEQIVRIIKGTEAKRSAKTTKLVEEIVNILVAAGYHDFRSLYPEN